SPARKIPMDQRPVVTQSTFLCLTLLAALAAAPLAMPRPCVAADTVQLSTSLHVYQGPINVGILTAEGAALLFDCGDGSVADALPNLGVTKVEKILFTHHHRDQACGAPRFVTQGTELVVPETERPWFDAVETYWNDPKSRWHIYSYHPHRLMLADSMPVAATVKPGDTIRWHGATITVLDTPGHTDGSVSYLVDVDGRKTIFSGDAIYDAGQIWELHSLQKGFQRGTRRIGDYHGFLGAQPELLEGLARIKAAGAAAIVPSHGRVIKDPPAAVDKLVGRLVTCYDRYVAISALRHYFPELFEEFAGRPGHMPIGPGIEVPSFLRHYGTSWVLVSQDKAAFVLDAGHERRIDDLKKLVADEHLTGVEGLWITHYHDDHTDAIPPFLAAFGCPCYADEHVAEVIANPLAWRIPCISPSVARVDKCLNDGESWQWHEFKLTSYFFPGQTLYHGGLLVEGRGVRLFFAGDSFTPAGIDDYCALNRNWLGRGAGFNACLDLLEELQPTHIFNCHVDKAFNFTTQQYRAMRENLAEREKLFGELFPWDHPNYGIDESWIRTFPYEQAVRPGDEVKLDVVITNHSSEARQAAARVALPAAWSAPTSDWHRLAAPPVEQTPLALRFQVPATARPGRYASPIDIRYADQLLPHFTEAIVTVGP
ncbi:MAG: MBL fold metallo-hydrolase, partial [Thermoguttaceae bacterium]